MAVRASWLAQLTPSMVFMTQLVAQVNTSWVTEQLAHRKLLAVQPTLKHPPNLHTLTYTLLHPMVHLILTPAGPVDHLSAITTMMSVPLKPAVALLLTKLLLSSLSSVAVSPGAGRTRTSWIPAIRGSAVVAIPAVVTRVRSTRATTLVTTAPTTVRARRCWRSQMGNSYGVKVNFHSLPLVAMFLSLDGEVNNMKNLGSPARGAVTNKVSD